MSKVSNYIAVIASGILLTVPLATKANASPVKPETPLPVCSNEDGYGIALCTFDGVVSGDCAPDYVGGFDVSQQCVALHRNNKEAVKECVVEWNLFDPNDPKYKGFTFRECLLAMQ